MMISRAWRGVAFVAVACLVLAGFSTVGVHAQDTMKVAQESPGFRPTMTNMGQGEYVAPFNGGLTVTHPSAFSLPQNLGGSIRLLRVYNSKFEGDVYDDDAFFAVPVDKPTGVLGVGWTLTLGRVLARTMQHEIYNDPDRLHPTYETRVFYFYQGEDGGEHKLYRDSTMENWISADTEPSTSWYFTNDGSYIRAKYDISLHQWTIYFPNGSKSITGGVEGNSFVRPIVQGHMTVNPNTNGWYVTRIEDRVGNFTTITYRDYNAVSQPYAGAISSIQDQFGRMITLNYYDATDPLYPNLLASISCAGRTESFFYDQVAWTPPGLPLGEYPALSRAVNPAGQETLYRYAPCTRGGIGRSCLTQIFYPTGAVSEYEYQGYAYTVAKYWIDPEHNEWIQIHGLGVFRHTVRAGHAALGDISVRNALVWTWDRSNFPDLRTYWLSEFGIVDKVQPILLTDPLGTQEAIYFVADSMGSPSLPPGTEVFSVHRLPGASTFDPDHPLLYAASSTKTDSELGDAPLDSSALQGDSHRCIQDGVAATSVAPYGNLRAFRKTASEYGDTPQQDPLGLPANPPVKWQRVSQSFAWDGFGHYQITQLSGSPSPGVKKVSATFYHLKISFDEPVIYQTDRMVHSYSGTGEITYTPPVPANPNTGDPAEAGFYDVSGDFSAAHISYDDATGLADTQRSFNTLVHSWGLCFGPGLCPEGLYPANAAGDKVLALTYDDHGNIKKLVYSGGDNSAQYGFNFEWQYGMVAKMWHDGLSYNDFTRAIDPDTSLITSNTDSNILTTSYKYDALERLTKIIPPGGEHVTYIYYPGDETTYSGQSWATGHDILFYVGPETFTPDVDDSLAGIDAGAAYAHYIFDDLGRLVRTRSLHPEGYLTETVTAYDPLGQAFFTSLPYRQGDWVIGSVSLTFPLAPNFGTVILPAKTDLGGTLHPYGAVSSIYSQAAWTGNIQDLVLGLPDEFYRPVWSFKPDGSKTGTAYDGLNTTVTLFGIKTGQGTTSDSPMTYTKDVFGRLLHVDAPIGADAYYTYDGLGRLIHANLDGQTRTWTYDALGRLRSATNPENDTTNFLKYDCIGNLLESQDANGLAATTAYKLVSSYDQAGRLLTTNKTAMDGTTVLQPLIANTYDAASLTLPDDNEMETGASLGKLVQNISYQKLEGDRDVASRELFSYDTATGRVNYQGQATEAGGGYEENGITPSYDQYGQVTDETLPGLGAVLSNVYSHGAMVSRLQNGNAILSALKYDPAGAMTEIDFATGEVEHVAMDQYERPIGFNFVDSDGQTQRWGNGSFADPNLPYEYDGAGNIASIGSAQGVSDNFTYDLLSRLTNATINRQGYAHAYNYAYDAFGNLLGRTEQAHGSYGLEASLMNTASYRTPSQAPDKTAADNYIKAVAFTAQLQAGPNGVTTNRLSSVQRGGTLDMGGTQYATGIDSVTSSMAYDANGNLIDDGLYVYGYDALSRQVAVWDHDASQTDNKGALVAEYAYLASGERIAAVKYTGGEASDYTRYVREGGAVVWERTDSTGHEKRYIYAGGRMAYTSEFWEECSFPRTLTQTQALATSSVAPDANGQTVTATIALPGLPEEANAVEVRLVKGNSLVASQRIDRPEGGQWCGVEQATFAGLVEGNDYQAGITLFFREGRAKVMPLKAYLVQRIKLGIVKGKLAAWTIKRLKADNDNVTEETTTGFAGLAPEGAEDYTALAGHSGAMEEVAQGRQVDEAQVPQGTASVSVQGSAGTSMSLAAPSLGGATLNGGIVPQCTRHAVNTYYATDHLGTVRFTKTIDDDGNETTTTHDYEPFGVEIARTDECGNTHKFTGHERDAETGNDYMHFRFFSASMGRFQKPDSNFDNPSNNPQGWNLYSYVKGNPVNFNDPTGHAASDPTQNTANVQGESTHTPEEEEKQKEELDKLRRREILDGLADLMQGPSAFHQAVVLRPISSIWDSNTQSHCWASFANAIPKAKNVGDRVLLANTGYVDSDEENKRGSWSNEAAAIINDILVGKGYTVVLLTGPQMLTTNLDTIGTLAGEVVVGHYYANEHGDGFRIVAGQGWFQPDGKGHWAMPSGLVDNGFVALIGCGTYSAARLLHEVNGHVQAIGQEGNINSSWYQYNDGRGFWFLNAPLNIIVY